MSARKANLDCQQRNTRNLDCDREGDKAAKRKRRRQAANAFEAAIQKDPMAKLLGRVLAGPTKQQRQLGASLDASLAAVHVAAFDANKDGAASCEEVLAGQRPLVEKYIEGLRAQGMEIDEGGAEYIRRLYEQYAATRFRAIDKNGDGKATPDELAALYGEMDAEVAANALQQLDPNQDGKLSRCEAKKLVKDAVKRGFDALEEAGIDQSRKAKKKMMCSSMEEVSAAFDRLDTNCDGNLTADELTAAVAWQRQMAQWTDP